MLGEDGNAVDDWNLLMRECCGMEEEKRRGEGDRDRREKGVEVWAGFLTRCASQQREGASVGEAAGGICRCEGRCTVGDAGDLNARDTAGY